MFKRILIPTDGSSASQRAILAGASLARETGAEIIGLTVTPPFHTLSADPEVLESTPAQYEQQARQQAERILADVESAAREAQVPYRIEHASGDSPYEIIISTARDAGCDLILMASHGRKGIKGLLLGSETQKVLVHSAIPVLVYR
ncbi:MAG TPA: universal stress protein [Massilia sp.]|nr:universal stress protein [Massilia sp.]